MPPAPSRSVRSLPGKANWASFPFTRRDDIPLPTRPALSPLPWDVFCGHGWMQLVSKMLNPHKAPPAPSDPLASS